MYRKCCSISPVKQLWVYCEVCLSNNFSCCAYYTGESLVEVKAEADSSDHTKHPHDDEPRPYLCAVCGKQFIKKQHLIKHGRLHRAKRYTCGHCRKSFIQRSNFRRHLGLVHRVTMTDELIDETTLVRFRANATRGPRRKSQPSSDNLSQLSRVSQSRPCEPIKSVIPHSPALSIVLESGTSRLAGVLSADQPNTVPLTHRIRIMKGKYKSLKSGSGEKTALALAQSSPTPTSTRSESPQPLTSRVKDRLMIRKPPSKLECRPHSLAAVSIQRRPLQEDSARPERRVRVEMSPLKLAQYVSERPDSTSVQIADGLVRDYDMSPSEWKHHVNIIRGMRAAERQLCTRLRRYLPMRMTQSVEEIHEFLRKVEHECQQAEQYASDEFETVNS